jgi:hypothetical protein
MIRPSTILRLAEDTVIKASEATAHSAKHFAHSVKCEYRAREIAREHRRILKMQSRLSSMTAQQVIEFHNDQIAIARRVAELLRSRDTYASEVSRVEPAEADA